MGIIAVDVFNDMSLQSVVLTIHLVQRVRNVLEAWTILVVGTVHVRCV